MTDEEFLSEVAKGYTWLKDGNVIYTRKDFRVVTKFGRSYLFKGLINIADKLSIVKLNKIEDWINKTRLRDIKTIESYESQILDLQKLIDNKKFCWGF